MMKIEKLVEFTLSNEIMARVPVVGKIELETDVPQDSMTLSKVEAIIRIEDSRNLAHGVDFGELRPFHLRKRKGTSPRNMFISTTS
jgi:hypothetical protein